MIPHEVIILSGLPGSGKSTLARFLLSLASTGDGLVVSADDHFVGPDGAYRYIPTQVGRAHMECQQRFEAALKAGRRLVIVDNTNTTLSEIKVYVKLAESHHYRVKVMRLVGVDAATCFERQRHNVPPEMFERLVARFHQRNVDPAWNVADISPRLNERSIVDRIGDLA